MSHSGQPKDVKGCETTLTRGKRKMRGLGDGIRPTKWTVRSGADTKRVKNEEEAHAVAKDCATRRPFKATVHRDAMKVAEYVAPASAPSAT